MGTRLVRRGRIWYCWVPKPGGGVRRVGTNCTDRKAAEARARELERRAADPAYQAAHTTTFAVVADRFLASRKRAGRAAGTLHHYEVKTSHLVRLLPRIVAEVNMSHVERYIDAREREGAARTTVKKELRALHAVLKYAKRSGLFTADIDAVMPEYADDYQPRKRALTVPEVRALLVALEEPAASQTEDRSRNRAAMVAFMIAVGARWSEAVRAQREDITDRLVHLRGSKTARAREGRHVPVVSFTAKLIGYVLEVVGDRKGRLFDAWLNPGRDIALACEQAGIDRASPNDFRRTYSTWLRAAGVDVATIAAALGHTTSRMVERVYGRLSPEDLRASIAGRLLDRKGEKQGYRALLPGTRNPGEKA